MKEMTLTQPERAKLALRDGDVVVVEGGNGFGKSAIWRATLPGVVAYQNHVLRLRVAQDSYPTEYLSHWARWCHEQGHFRPTGSGIPNIGLGRARSMPIRISESETLPDELLAASAADAAADGARATADTLRTLRSDLLTVLVSGEHEIPASYDAMMGEVA
jgi:type I restriction enzyme S subunit